MTTPKVTLSTNVPQVKLVVTNQDTELLNVNVTAGFPGRPGTDGFPGRPGTDGVAAQFQVNGEDVGTPSTSLTFNMTGDGLTGSAAGTTTTIDVAYSGLYKGDWDMSSGAYGAAKPDTATGATYTQYSMTPVSPTVGGPSAYLSAVESSGGILLTGADTRSASITAPAYDPADTVILVGLVLVNSGATINDVLDVLSSATPTNPTWLAGFTLSQVDQNSVLAVYNNDTLTGVDSLTATIGQPVVLSLNYTNGRVQMLANGSPSDPGIFHIEDIPAGQYLRLIAITLNVGQTVVFDAGGMAINFSETAGGLTGFQEYANATIPAGALDLDSYSVTAGGWFHGQTTSAGQTVQLINDKTALIITPAVQDGPVQSVNGQAGVVELDATDVGADPAGTAQGLINALTPGDIGAEVAGAAAALHAVSYDTQELTAAQQIQAQRNLGTQVFVGTAFPTGAVAPAVLAQFAAGGMFTDFLIMQTAGTLWDPGNSSLNGSLSDSARTAAFTTGAIVAQTARTVGKASGKVNCGIILDTGPSSSDALLAVYWKNNAGEYAGVYFRMDTNNTTTGIGGLDDWLLNLSGGNDGTTGHLAGLLVGQAVRVLVDIATGAWSVQTGSYSVTGHTTLSHNVAGWFEVQLYHYPSGSPVLTGVVEVLASDYGDYVAIGT